MAPFVAGSTSMLKKGDHHGDFAEATFNIMKNINESLHIYNHANKDNELFQNKTQEWVIGETEGCSKPDNNIQQFCSLHYYVPNVLLSFYKKHYVYDFIRTLNYQKPILGRCFSIIRKIWCRFSFPKCSHDLSHYITFDLRDQCHELIQCSNEINLPFADLIAACQSTRHRYVVVDYCTAYNRTNIQHHYCSPYPDGFLFPVALAKKMPELLDNTEEFLSIISQSNGITQRCMDTAAQFFCHRFPVCDQDRKHIKVFFDWQQCQNAVACCRSDKLNMNQVDGD
ncbi:uncharacterized protein TRIADDRAFT_59593 [Trichoplax adhaerens]|uniref:FZ domain-containing protein n=1 Tax=Trichoplax adhaerens TaxID=10228 RepID=B3S5F1_TRIAD|nr:predicted protein [Trichoplax adhaerens]EDV22028.1 predicted protein [Trichoplax adhaerens]|eukprot:XP_002115665.1 predicted protein [Trichoplax adhaerens]